MASGKTEDMIAFANRMRWRRLEPKPKTPRDRSLRGKARVKARKAANRK